MDNKIKHCYDCGGELIEGDYEYSPERDEYNVIFSCELCGLDYTLYYILNDYLVKYPNDDVYWDEENEFYVRLADMSCYPHMEEK